MKTRTAEIMLMLALALRGTSLLFGKIALRTMGPLLLLGIRFSIAFVLVAIVFRKQIKNTTWTVLWHSALLSIFFVGSMAFELNGLKTTPSSTTAFLENGIIVIVPIITAFLEKRLPSRITVVSALIAVVGTVLMTMKGVHLGFTHGEFLVICGTLCYAIALIVTDKISKNDDPALISIYQLLFIGAFSLIASFVAEKPVMPTSSTEWGAILWLAIVCSGVGFTLQPFGQKYTSADRAGLFTAFNPISAAILGVLFLHERLSLTTIAGSLLVLLAVVLPSLVNIIKGKKQGAATLDGEAVSDTDVAAALDGEAVSDTDVASDELR